ncbi:MAG: hypothetical protein E6Q34_08295 [Burkholderiaceae bacterium]|nr:MAG: hypothetical protein E6Q34_08295 [Burkholderiaceae bacterium]
MKKISSLMLTLLCIAFAGCHKKNPEASGASTNAVEVASAAANAPAPVSKPEVLTEEQEEMKRKKDLLDYSVMEDQYLNDAKAQWATSAKASGYYGEGSKSTSNAPANATGAPNGETWSNAQQDMGFDWLEVSYEKPVNATEVRAVFTSSHAVESVTKLELQDADGKWNLLWSGVSDQKYERRGPRTWFVRKFDKTAYKVKAVKFTFANNVSRGYKEADAVQLVGE